jgi:hypothetical protein
LKSENNKFGARMNLEKLKKAEMNFMQRYPGGFSNPEMLEISKKHKIEKMTNLTKERFAIGEFDNSENIIESMIKIVSSSSMVSLFEKPKFRDFVRNLDMDRKNIITNAVKQLIHGNEESGFEILVDILQEEKLAKWTLITVIPAYYSPKKDVFIKPTTTKGVINYFELEDLIYKPLPSYDFYNRYRDEINNMKEKVSEQLSTSNAAFSGFLMMVMAGL